MQQPVFDDAFRAQLHGLFRWRRDVRHFLTTPVPAAVQDALFAAAELAPSVGLSEPWRFVIVEDPARRAAIAANFARCNALALAQQAGADAALYAGLKLAGLDAAPVQFALFCDLLPAQGRALGRRTMPEMAEYSTVLALHTLWLAAQAHGLGLGWVSILDPAEVAVALDVPAEWRLIGYFCLGVPAGPSATPELERAGWERRSARPPLRR